MAAPPLRKPNKRLGGLEVRVCGHYIQYSGGDVICTLPPSKHLTHSAVAISKDRKTVYAFLKTSGGDVQVWQLAEAPE